METLVIRTASSTDRDALERLAVLDEAPIPAGRVLVAAVDGELAAAVSIESGDAVADPFRATADAVELLRAQARRLRVAERHDSTLAERLGIRRPLARAA